MATENQENDGIRSYRQNSRKLLTSLIDNFRNPWSRDKILKLVETIEKSLKPLTKIKKNVETIEQTR